MDMSAALALVLGQVSLLELWKESERGFRHPGDWQLSVVAVHVLGLPASESHVERLNKALRRIVLKAGPRLPKMARLALSATV